MGKKNLLESNNAKEILEVLEAALLPQNAGKKISKSSLMNLKVLEMQLKDFARYPEKNVQLVPLALKTCRVHCMHGNYSDARYWCEKALCAAKLDPTIHLLLAMILVAQENHQEAIQTLKKALFLNPRFVIAHTLLATLLQCEDEAREHHTKALEMLSQLESDELLEGGEGLTASRLSELLH